MKLLTALTAGSAAFVTAAALSLPASAQTVSHTPETPAIRTLTVRQIAFGARLHHRFRPNGTGAVTTETLSSPDDIALFQNAIFVTFQNGVGPQGQASPSGDLDSTIVEFTLTGREVRQWDLRGKCDGLTADPRAGIVIATINEDAHSSLDTIRPATGAVTHYVYNRALPHKGGTDAISIYRGQILISASAPGTTGTPAPNPKYPAVYLVTLNHATRIATVHPLFYDEAPALAANGPHKGQIVRLTLTDPDSNEVVPAVAPRYDGDFMLDSQGDQELIFDRPSAAGQHLTVLLLPHSVDDSAWVTGRHGAIYTTDNSADTVDVVRGAFVPGTMYSAVTPCDQNDAPATCPAPGFPPHFLAVTNMRTGALTAVPTTGPALEPQGMIFVP